MRRLILLLLLVLPIGAIAQRLDINGWGKENDPFVEVYGFFSASSSDFSSSFARKAVFSEALSAEEIENEYNHLSEVNNLIGFDYESAIRSKLSISDKGGLIIKLSDFVHADALVDRNLFGLAFKGNAPFAGDSLRFTSSSFTYSRFQQIGVGYSHQISDQLSIYGMASLIHAQSTISGALYQGNLYTSNFGDTVAFDALFSGLQSNPEAAFGNGLGAALSLGMSSLVEISGTEWLSTLSIENLGLVQWNTKTTLYSIDTSVVYYGLEINPFDENIGGSVSEQIDDSLSFLLSDIKRTSWSNAAVPGNAQFSLVRILDEGLAAALGISYRWQSNFKTYAWLNAGYKFENGISVLGELGYGGYTALQTGVLLNVEFETIQVQARVANLEALFTPKNNLGLTSFLGLKYNF